MYIEKNLFFYISKTLVLKHIQIDCNPRGLTPLPFAQVSRCQNALIARQNTSEHRCADVTCLYVVQTAKTEACLGGG